MTDKKDFWDNISWYDVLLLVIMMLILYVLLIIIGVRGD